LYNPDIILLHLNLNREIGEECKAFRAGMLSVIPIFSMFSWKELQTLISGSDKPIDVEDWRKNTNYGTGFADNHPTIQMFWQVRSFSGLLMLSRLNSKTLLVVTF
jgi:ubiquitin-protein ligase E3 C